MKTTEQRRTECLNQKYGVNFKAGRASPSRFCILATYFKFPYFELRILTRSARPEWQTITYQQITLQIVLLSNKERPDNLNV